jgi:uncharacterized membrane protein YhfC
VMASRGLIPAGPVLEGVSQQTAALDFWRVQLAALERASAMAVHVGLALIVLQMWIRGGIRWLLLAILLHFAINSIAAILVLELRLSQWIGELLLVAMAAAVLTLGWRLAERAKG